MTPATQPSPTAASAASADSVAASAERMDPPIDTPEQIAEREILAMDDAECIITRRSVPGFGLREESRTIRSRARNRALIRTANYLPVERDGEIVGYRRQDDTVEMRASYELRR